MQDWVEKYRPKSLGDIVGNNTAVRQLAEWAAGWKIGDDPVLLYGKPGIGKTSAVYALAADMKWEIVELNASDDRTKSAIDRIAGTTATTQSLTGASRKLLVFDEADNLYGNADRGGARAILDTIKNSRQPIVLIANDIYGVAKELKSVCTPIQFRSLQARSIVPRLKYICSAEGINCDENSLINIAEESSGDLRSAINMLHAASAGDNVGAGAVATSSKDERSTIFDLVSAAFKEKDDKKLMAVSFEIPDTPDATEQWLEDNLPSIKDPADMALGYRYISKADEFLGDTFRRQYYTLWRYAGAVMLIGTAVASKGEGVSGRISPPSRWGKMYRAKKQKALRNSLFRTLSENYHMPEDTLRDDMLIPLSIIADNSPHDFARRNNLDKDELDFFLHDKAKSDAVIKDIRKAEKEKEKAEKGKKIPKKSVAEVKPPVSAPKTPEVSGTDPAGPDDETAEKKEDRSQATLFDGF
jgi:replication factor C large subunit